MFVNAAKGVSACQLGRDMNAQYKTAFVMAHKIGEAIGADPPTGTGLRTWRKDSPLSDVRREKAITQLQAPPILDFCLGSPDTPPGARADAQHPACGIGVECLALPATPRRMTLHKSHPCFRLDRI
jgi:hypothetical protein